ncbi:MAG: hypothetical protein K0R78_2977 [Pelosinus sp.]|jgi:hypothetical protein|nr:hypothetical protein [Pelosinus sp.]
MINNKIEVKYKGASYLLEDVVDILALVAKAVLSKIQLRDQTNTVVTVEVEQEKEQSSNTMESGMVINNLPEILTAKHISDYLNISRRRVYELFQLNPKFGGIPCFSIGTSKRVDKKDSFNGLNQEKMI